MGSRLYQTLTSEGLIDHFYGDGLALPVALKTERDAENRSRLCWKGDRPVPERDAFGRLLYATPGGGRTTGGRL